MRRKEREIWLKNFVRTGRMMTAGVFACLLLSACADKPTYDVDYDQGFPYAGYKTYRWYDDDHATRASIGAVTAATNASETPPIRN